MKLPTGILLLPLLGILLCSCRSAMTEVKLGSRVWDVQLPPDAAFDCNDPTGEIYILYHGYRFVFYAEPVNEENGDVSSAIAHETERYLGCFKVPFNLLTRNDSFEFHNWRGTLLTIHVPAREFHLMTAIVTQDGKNWIFLGSGGKKYFPQALFFDLLEQLGPVRENSPAP